MLATPFAPLGTIPTTEERSLASAQVNAWWRTTVIYQVYPRSVADGDGDGIGDCCDVAPLSGTLADFDELLHQAHSRTHDLGSPGPRPPAGRAGLDPDPLPGGDRRAPVALPRHGSARVAHRPPSARPRVPQREDDRMLPSDTTVWMHS